MSLKLVFFGPGAYTHQVIFQLRSLRKIFLWLLFIALPLQGFAWGQMPSCGNESQGIEVSASQTLGMSTVVAAPITVATDSDAKSPVGCDPAGKPMTHCVSSSTCAAALPLSAPSAAVMPSLMTATPQSRLALADIGFFTGAPERPPRLSAA